MALRRFRSFNLGRNMVNVKLEPARMLFCGRAAMTLWQEKVESGKRYI